MIRARFVALLALALLARTASAQQFLYDATALPAQNVWTNGVTLADVTGDGFLDILFANGNAYGGTASQGSQPQHLFVNDGTGHFVEGHAALHVADFNAQMVIAEDFDRDGDLDLMYASGATGSPPRLLSNDGGGTFTDVTASSIPPLALRSFCLCAGDTDNDGDLDVVVTDGGTFGGIASQARLLQNDGQAVFSDVTAARLPADLYNAQDVTLLDVDGDHDIDILLSGKGGTGKRGRLYLNDTTGTFTISTALDDVGTGGTYETDYGDLDGDGDFDAAVQSINGFAEGWARDDGTASAWVKTTFAASVSQDDNEMACFDYDVDGDLDVVVGSLGSTERFYANDGAGGISLAAGVIEAQADSTLDLAIGDLDGDGDDDLVTAQGESGNFKDKVYVNQGPADTRAPLFLSVETPPALGAQTTQFRCQLRDQVSDDGHLGVSATYSWTTVGGGSGSGEAFDLGTGLFSASVPTAGASSASVTWTATDRAGNVATAGPVTATGSIDPWTDLGRALAGIAGDPFLQGDGTLATASSGLLQLSQAAPGTLAVLCLSFMSVPAPLQGGVLCANPPVLLVPVMTDFAGNFAIGWASWPAGLSGSSLFFQFAIVDPAAIQGLALSNCVQGDVP